ncbi:Hpt domain-containing protein [Nitrospina watsonii]|uniref:HPt domain-containing protein n=1 Tax=Nitrospina watsonii TaxID=1323948 RepID=A0ABN8W555_9BACT|nr:Hpt domain-containing protein [Nitrospina watsonii]CAI2719305.1 HPt domain-containing protein [Nitrospina watsonii]
MNPPNPKTDKIAVHISEDLKPLIPGYLADRRRDLQRMGVLFEADDLAAIQEIAHMLKGSGASYGFDQLTVLGDELEMAAAGNQSKPVKSLLDRLANYLSRLEVVYT